MNILYKKDNFGLKEIEDNSIHCIITDPPYGINLTDWDKLPNKQIWKDCFRVLKPGGFLATFSSIKFQHIFTQQLLEGGFNFKDVLIWVYLNGRVPPIDIDKKIDKRFGYERYEIGEYKYVQGNPSEDKKDTYKKKSKKTSASNQSKQWEGFGTGLKTFYEPIILVQKPYNNLVDNIIENKTGFMNLENTRIPYDEGEKKVGHNPHPKGRVMGNIIQTESFGDYEKFFFVGKVRDGKKTGNLHPTKKPQRLIEILIELLTLENQIILDPFAGSGTTGIVANKMNRYYIMYEKENKYCDLIEKRLKESCNDN